MSALDGRQDTQRGTLIVFEGAEGVGKTTQVRRLVQWLEALQIKHHHLREPGGTAVGDAIRTGFLLDPMRTLANATEALLFLASRAQLVEDKIVPALADGDVVILDRFFLSTYAYQIGGRGLGETEIRYANKLAVGDLVPDVTLVLNLPVAVGMQRVAGRGSHDRIELAGLVFHERVAASFASFVAPAWQAAHPECGPIVPIDASGTETDVFHRIARELSSRWPHRFPSLSA